MDAALLLAYAEKGGAVDNWPAPLIGLLVVAILLVIAGIAYMVVSGRGDRQRPAG